MAWVFPPATITIERYSTLTLAPLVTYPIIYNTIFIISLGGDSIATVLGHNWRLFYKRVSNYDLTFGEEVLFVQQLSVFPCRLKLKFVLQQLLVGDHHSILGNQTLLHSARVPGSPLVTHSHSIIKTFKFIVLTNHQ